MYDQSIESNRSCRTKAILVQNSAHVGRCLGGRLFSAWPKHGASPLFWRPARPPERLYRTIAGTEKSGEQDGSIIFMPERNFRRVELDLEQAVAKLNKAKDPEVRRELLLEMRHLPREVDSLNEKSE